MQHTRPKMSESGLTIGRRRKSLSKILNRQRSMPIVTHKINSPKRLVGGTDEEPAIEETPAKDLSPESVQEVPNSSSSQIPSTPPLSAVEKSLEESVQLRDNSQNKQLLFTNGPCCFCIPQTPGSVGDRKVDEIIEYVHQNLEEAGKALATLGENFEHNLKLVVVDIMGRIKQWTSIVQNKLDASRNEVNNLRKELLARACEIDVKTRELKDLKDQIADYQNRLLNGELLKKDPKRSKLELKDEREASIREDQPGVEDARVTNAKEIIRASKTNGMKNAMRVVDDEKEESVQAADRIDERNGEKEKGVRVVDRIDERNGEKEKRARAVDRIDERNGEKEKRARAVDRIDEDEEDREDTERIVDRIYKDEEDGEDKERVVDRARIDETIERIKDEEESPRRRRDERKTKDVTCTDVAVQTIVEEKERMKRESELESEVKRLQKEYNRVIKQRAEYENAIQRALLRGVSSLNVEALRVLRCPPIPCCSPCVPCPTTAGIIPPEPVVPCPGKSTKRRSGSVATASNVKISRDKNMQSDDPIDCTTKRSYASSCYFANRNRKSTNGGMVFLLHQGDARNLDAPDEVCDSTIIKKIELPPMPRFEVG